MPSSTSSSTPVTVTVCAVLQPSTVNVRLSGDTAPSPSSRLATATVTAAEGRVSSATGNVAVPPASVACPAVPPTTRPTSSSRFTTDTRTTPSAS